MSDTIEQEKEEFQLTLDKNELDKLNLEGGEEPEPIDIANQKDSSEPIVFRECVKIFFGNFSCELYSSSLGVESLAGIFLELKKNFTEPIKNGGYIG